MDRVDLFSPARCEVTITNNRVTVEVDRKPVLRVVRIGKLEVDDQRAPSGASMRHFHACVKKAWDSLPDHASKQFTQPDNLREYVLIRAGYSNLRIIPLTTPDDALRLAGIVTSHNAVSIVTVEDTMVCVHTAKSQSEMSREDFHQSKTACLEILAGMVGVSVDQLSANAS